jgi:cytochrome c oxidase subunit I+III
MHLTGLRGMPRRVYTFDPALGVNGLNMGATIFTFVMAAGVLVVLVDIIRHFRHGRIAGANPWDAPSLEWVAGNAPHGFRSLPIIESRYPGWDDPELAQKLDDARGYLPDAPTGERESLMTSPIAGEPEQILRMPGPSWTPFISALALATFFIALTLKLTIVGIASGMLTVGSLLWWFWNLDKAYPRALADAGRGLGLPLYRNDSRSAGWWAMAILLVVDVSITVSFLFAYLFLWTVRPAVWPPDGSQVPDLSVPAVLVVLVGAACLSFETAERFNRRDKRLHVIVTLSAVAVLSGVALVYGGAWPGRLGIDPTRHSYGAAVWMLLGWAGLHAAIGGFMAVWCIARSALGMLDSWRCLTLRVCLLWWRFTVAATALVLVLVAGFPYAFR